ncbi:MAG: hypothetical protein ACREOJ_11300 [Gemmatimonadaceae bacterium]
MEEHEAEQEAEYPRGRGYGHDYMRGGEVFGGYGYSDRREYVRPRGATGDEPTAGDDEEFPQDERAGGWAIPRDMDGPAAMATPADGQADGDGARDVAVGGDAQDLGAGAPVPLIDRTLGGATIGGLDRSRSYYVTQAQLQQRLYRTPKQSEPGKS